MTSAVARPGRPSTWSVREGQLPEDADAIVRLMNVYDTEATTTSEFLRLSSSWSSSDPRQRLVAVDGEGAVIGTSHCRHRASMKPGLFALNVLVDPNKTGRGLGSELALRAEDFARAQGAREVMAYVPETDSRGRGFAERRGYHLSRHLFGSELKVAQVDGHLAEASRARMAEASVDTVSMAEIGWGEAHARRLYDVMSECDQDEPSSAEMGILSWEDFQRIFVDAETFTPKGVFVALVGGTWAGIHVLWPVKVDGDTDVNTVYTGVRRPYRGLGIATALKLCGVAYAREAGGTRITTYNDSANAAMLAVNRKLGFQSRPGWFFMAKGAEDAR